MHSMTSGLSTVAVTCLVGVVAGKAANTAVSRARKIKARRRQSPVVGLKQESSHPGPEQRLNQRPTVTKTLHYPEPYLQPQRGGGITVTATHHGPPDPLGHSDDPVMEAANEAVRLEILRQLHSINTDDDDWRIDPLPTFEGDGSTTSSR